MLCEEGGGEGRGKEGGKEAQGMGVCVWGVCGGGGAGSALGVSLETIKRFLKNSDTLIRDFLKLWEFVREGGVQNFQNRGVTPA